MLYDECLNLSHAPLPMVWYQGRGMGLFANSPFLKSQRLKINVTFEVSTLVAVYSSRETVVDDVVFPQYFDSCSCRLVSGREGLCIARELSGLL